MEGVGVGGMVPLFWGTHGMAYKKKRKYTVALGTHQGIIFSLMNQPKIGECGEGEDGSEERRGASTQGG